MSDRSAIIVVPGAADVLIRGGSSPRTLWEHDVLLAPKWRYTLVKPGSWRGLLRGRLPQPGQAASKVAELARWNQTRWPGAELFVVIPAGRKIWWRQVSELAAAISHLPVAAIDYASTSRLWPTWIARRQPGDLILIDDTLVAGQKLAARLEALGGNNIQLARAGALLPQLRALAPNEHRLIIAPADEHGRLLATGADRSELVATQADRVNQLRRELASREPNSILLIQSAADTDDLMGRFRLDDELTQMTRLLDEHGYGVRVIGAPASLSTSGAWPVIEWSDGQKARLPAGWERRHATLRHVRQAVRDSLAS